MLQRFYPGGEVESVHEIAYEALFAEGWRGVIFDIDNTLVPHGAPADEQAVALFKRLHDIGFATMLLSNNKEPRVKSFAEQVDSPYIYKAGKPGAEGYERAMRTMGTDRATTLFVGDQLFTDVYGANRLGLRTYLSKPIHPKEEIQIVLKRILEKPILFFYHRKK